MQYNVAILHYLGLNFRIFFWIFTPNDLDTKTLLKVVKWLYRFIQGNYQAFYSGKLSSVLFREIIKRFIQGNYKAFYSGKLSNVLIREIIKRFIRGIYQTFYSGKL